MLFLYLSIGTVFILYTNIDLIYFLMLQFIKWNIISNTIIKPNEMYNVPCNSAYSFEGWIYISQLTRKRARASPVFKLDGAKLPPPWDNAHVAEA